MTDVIRTVEVEFLRPGPPHNQLLSPLTQYLAVSGDAGAGTVTVPFEQAAFNRRLGDLRYLDDDEQDQSRRLETLRTVGTLLGEVMDGVPGLVGSLNEQAGGETLINLRIVSSASELAMLPFELSKVPSGIGRPSDEWLALRAGTQLCITRRERSVVPKTGLWPELPPTVLFVVGLEVDTDLEKAHLNALKAALKPWKGGKHEPLIHLKAKDASIRGIMEELRKGVTSVHILAHGAAATTTESEQFGLLLTSSGSGNGDIVTGERFASVLRSLPVEVSQPSTVVVAACDSAYQADVLIPGGSFARALHVAGVPLVVASQFPLTFEGATRLTELLYERLSWGENPLPAIATVRAALHAELPHSHDWASLVVYDALQDDFDSQLDRVRYRRARLAMDAALGQLDDGELDIDEAEERVELALSRLPTTASYRMETQALHASYAKRMAHHQYRSGDHAKARAGLERAHRIYRTAANRFLQSDIGPQHWGSLHWLESQAISLDRVLGFDPAPGTWSTARRAADLDQELEDRELRAWAHASLAELWLLRLFEPDLDEAAATEAESEAMKHARAILNYFALASDFHVLSTRRQLQRYVDWWGTNEFAGKLKLRGRSDKWNDVRELATSLVAVLDEAANTGDDD